MLAGMQVFKVNTRACPKNVRTLEYSGHKNLSHGRDQENSVEATAYKTSVQRHIANVTIASTLLNVMFQWDSRENNPNGLFTLQSTLIISNSKGLY